MDYTKYLSSLETQKATLKDAAFSEPSTMKISPEQAEWMQMLGAVEIQISIVKKRILTNNQMEFDVRE